jgi:hypothetical protein
MTTTSSLIKVYDCREDDWPPANLGDFLSWLHSQGINDRDVYRIEIHMIDGPVARIFEYETDGDNVRFLIDDNVVATREPYDKLLDSLPPGLNP